MQPDRERNKQEETNMGKTDTNDNEKLKICMLGHKRVPSREGGIEIVVEELAARMAALGHSVVCYNRSGHHVGGREFDSGYIGEYKGIQLRDVFTIDKKGLAAVSSSFFGCLAAGLGSYDVVHIHAEGPAAFCWIPRLFGKRVILTVHGLDWQREKWQGGFGSTYIHFGERMGVRWAHEIIVLSEGVRRYFQETYGRRTRYIPNGVTRPVFLEPNLILTKIGVEKNSYILYLGRIVPEKGIHYLIEAFLKVRTEKKLVIAGGSSDTGEYLERLKQMAAKDNRVVFTGFVQGQMLQELYSNAYFYTLPSDLEGMPLSLLEAMSYGNCCLVSDIEECTAVVEDKAMVFMRGAIEDLREKMQILCDDEEMILGYRRKAADFIGKKYNWEDIVRQTLRLYR